ncbi:19592_t:CDS:2, partial [Gigaspora rosea]
CTSYYKKWLLEFIVNALPDLDTEAEELPDSFEGELLSGFIGEFLGVGEFLAVMGITRQWGITRRRELPSKGELPEDTAGKLIS